MISQFSEPCDDLLAEFIVKAQARLLYLEEVDEIFARGAGRLPEEYVKYLRDLVDGNRHCGLHGRALPGRTQAGRRKARTNLRVLLDKVGIALPASPSPASGPKLSVVSDRGEAAGNDAGGQRARSRIRDI